MPTCSMVRTADADAAAVTAAHFGMLVNPVVRELVTRCLSNIARQCSMVLSCCLWGTVLHGAISYAGLQLLAVIVPDSRLYQGIS